MFKFLDPLYSLVPFDVDPPELLYFPRPSFVSVIGIVSIIVLDLLDIIASIYCQGKSVALQPKKLKKETDKQKLSFCQFTEKVSFNKKN